MNRFIHDKQVVVISQLWQKRLCKNKIDRIQKETNVKIKEHKNCVESLEGIIDNLKSQIKQQSVERQSHNT